MTMYTDSMIIPPNVPFNLALCHLAFLLLALLPAAAFAEATTILTCTEERSASIVWEYASTFKKEGMSAEANNSASEPIAISFVISNAKAILKGNAAQVDLKKVAPNAFLEVTPVGNTFLWSVIAGDGKIPTYVIQQKAYKMAGPVSYLVAYRCN